MPVEPQPVFKNTRKENWKGNKPEYYGFFFKKITSADTEVNVTLDSIVIKPPGLDKNKDTPLYISINSESEARDYLALIADIDVDKLELIRDDKFSFMKRV